MRQEEETTTILTQQTSRFIGKCDSCVYPISVENADAWGDFLYIPCPECGQTISCERLYGTLNFTHTCDDSCQCAIGVECVCSCGGAYHGIGFLVREGTDTRSAIARYRAEFAKRSESAKKVAAVKREKKVAAKQAARAEWDAANADVVAWIDANAVSTSRSWSFATSLAEQLDRKGSLSDGQVAAVRKSIVREAEWAAKQAAEAAKPKLPAPLGKGIAVTGTVLAVKDYDGYMAGQVNWKMLVEHADGWKVWSTIPASIQEALYAAQNAAYAHWQESGTGRDKCSFGLVEWLKGKTVTFTATLEIGRDGDKFFAVAKRPTRASVVE